MMQAKTILVVIGSTRPRRIGPAIAAWVADLGRAVLPARLDLVDLKAWRLPLDAEPEIPAAGRGYRTVEVQAWSQAVAQADGFIFVTPQYNWGYPAPLKNALDQLYREWQGKPAMIVSYGGHGGGKCAAQLRDVLEGLSMQPVATMPGLRLARARIEANEGQVEPAADFAAALPSLQQAFAELGAAITSR